MTVPLARQFHVANLNLLGALGVLFPSEYDGRTGIYLLDPYEPGKIPVVFVHGLMSSPEAWDNAMNDLRGDPELRKRYQFWMFFYSTGNPILASGARFRKSLSDLRAQLDPERKDPAFDRMVLIGHSMGGLLSRLAIASSGQTLWNTASKVPPEQIEMDPQLKDLMMQSLIFEPVPMVSRVVFVSTPHRGSPLGDELVGRLASKMIRVPNDILQIRKTLAQYNGQLKKSEALRGSRYATSVAQLGVGQSRAPIDQRVAVERGGPLSLDHRLQRQGAAARGGRWRCPLYERSHRRSALRADRFERPLRRGDRRGHRGDEADSHGSLQRVRAPAAGTGPGREAAKSGSLARPARLPSAILAKPTL